MSFWHQNKQINQRNSKENQKTARKQEKQKENLEIEVHDKDEFQISSIKMSC